MSRSLKKNKRVLPGFGLSLGYTVFYLSLIVLIPLAGVFWEASHLGWDQFWATVTDQRVAAAYSVSFLSAFEAAVFNVFAGLLTAWVLVRYDFPGRRILDALVDLPFALPTAVAGISLSTLYAPTGWLGQFFDQAGIQAVNSQFGITIALTFIGFPFVVRTVQPVLQELESEVEDAALSLGASRPQVFIRIILPALAPALLTGFTLAFARAVGEYGSVIFIAGNIPFQTEIAPLMIMGKLDEFNYAGAAAVASVMLILSFAALVVLNLLQHWRQKIAQGGAL